MKNTTQTGADIFFSGVKNFRYEHKFYIKNLSYAQIESILKTHPAMFSEIYHRRVVNNIYFDSFNMRHYFDNINGKNRRLKVRIRWYGEIFGKIENPVLELKLKHNMHIGKTAYHLKPFALDKRFSLDLIRDIFDASSLPPMLKVYLKGLDFSLLNRYSRKYFLSANKAYRVTIDNEMEARRLFSSSNNFMHAMKSPTDIIVELKYNKLHDKTANDITNYFPFRMTRSSKYVLGVERALA